MHERARFRRSRRDRIVAGVAGGLARDMGASPGVVRLGFVLLAWLYLVGAILYVALWIAMPAEPEPAEVEGPTGRALRRTEGGIRLLRRALGVVAGIVGLAQVAIPLAGDVRGLTALLARADSAALAPGPTAPANGLVGVTGGGGPGTSQPAAPAAARRSPAPTPLPVVDRDDPASVAMQPAVLPPEPVDYTPRDAADLRALVATAGEVETAALWSLDEAPLYGVFVGEALAAELEAVRDLRDNSARRAQRLLHREILRVASDGSAGEVDMVERWSMELRSTITGECVAFPAHTVPQTVHFTRTTAGWRVARIAFHDDASPVPQPCAGG